MLLVTATAGAVAFASRDGEEQLSGRALTVSNRVLAEPNTGPEGDGNSGELLLRLPGFGDFTITGCTFRNGVPNSNFSFRNTANVRVEVIGISAFNRDPTFAPGESAIVEFFGGQHSQPRDLLLTAGMGEQLRVASIHLTSLFETATNQCSFVIQATAQSARHLGKG